MALSARRATNGPRRVRRSGMVEPLGTPDRPHVSEIGGHTAFRYQRRVVEALGVASGPPDGRLGFEATVETADATVQVLEVLPGCLGLVGRFGSQGGDERFSFRLEASPPEGGTQGGRRGGIGLDGERSFTRWVGPSGIDRPALAPLDRPIPDQVLDGLVGAVSDDMDAAGLACPAHGDVAKLASAAVREEVGGVDSRSLAAVHGGGVAVGEAIRPDVVGSEAVLPSVVHGGEQAPGVHLDGSDHAALGRDDVAIESTGSSTGSSAMSDSVCRLGTVVSGVDRR